MIGRKFTCYGCGHVWKVPYGTLRPAACPECKSTNIHRAEEDRGYARHGMKDPASRGRVLRKGTTVGMMGMSRGDGTGPPDSRARGAGRGRMSGSYAAGPRGKCRCPRCGYETPHTRGTPCTQMKCPKCGTLLTRE